MKLLNKEAILGAPDLKHEDVEVLEWGGAVRVRMMTGAERDEFRQSIASENGVLVGRFSVALLAATLIDEDGTRLFSMDELDQLAEKGAAALDKPAAVAMRLNGLAGGALEDAAKNSVSTQSDDSGSALPSASEKP